MLFQQKTDTAEEPEQEQPNPAKENKGDIVQARSEKELYDTMVAHLTANQENHIMFYVALTGDEKTFNRRISVLEHFENVKKQLIIEEADYGSHCENQLKKIRKLWKMNVSYNYITTGTGWDKVKKISDELGNVKLYKREYLKDVLGSK